MIGDQLARGGRSATFAASDKPKSHSELEWDLKNLDAEAFNGKYGTSHDYYQELIGTLAAGAPLPTLAPVVKIVPAEDSVPHLVDNSALFAKKKPAVIYKGKPLGDMVLVRRVERESSSMIVLPDSAKGKSDMGVVASAGEGKYGQGFLVPLSVNAGDLILFDKFAAVGMEISLMDENGEEAEYLILREHDILLTLEVVKNTNSSESLQ